MMATSKPTTLPGQRAADIEFQPRNAADPRPDPEDGACRLVLQREVSISGSGQRLASGETIATLTPAGNLTRDQVAKLIAKGLTQVPAEDRGASRATI